jgi:acetyl-CoA carboxylase biotin carboxylase subunit
MFKSVLIANRGEIACRIIRTLKAMDIRAIAVYSDADAGARHVEMADDAVHIGEAHPLKSYLDQDAVLAAAKSSGAEAIHPGYGFLSENAGFARRVVAAGLTWIGPHPDAIDKMGNKQAARRTMNDAGVPLVPGADVAELEAVRHAAADLGYPVMIKAAAGGGGIGMKIVWGEDELAAALEEARTRAERSFGDGSVYVEKYVEEPHHIEMQIFGDKHGNVLHIFERECSVQRRHQKVVEESPSPMISDDTRRRMAEAAIRGSHGIGYDNAGTLEFLVDRFQNFYFLEMNTRLQVEHPVTEEVTGLDLVRLQLEVAAGRPLPITQDDVKQSGHAMEFRIYAENPKNFFPAPGTITTLVWPEGEGVRIDTGVREGDTITPFYDPMIAKLITHGRSRDEALSRMRRAVEATRIEGIKTNLPFLLEVLDDPDFRMGNYTTHLIHKLRPKL